MERPGHKPIFGNISDCAESTEFNSLLIKAPVTYMLLSVAKRVLDLGKYCWNGCEKGHA
jgi:hypothetical protein